ncbi:hypothetical protein [Zunongwangia pacifica]|uniref:DUF4397 domain-containing protein n=1 Tax=Zunongwangia pacifica TaxID=2911062 RepID=A0A9X2CM68_9FLAO|nr:hypothetical protein [Zunongwangia pacifica]MCL6217139.1 hypothetical protein [Zunongwangia pacifica]
MRKNYVAAIAMVFLIQFFSSCNSDDVLVTENKRTAIFATLVDSNDVALHDIPVNVTTNIAEDYNILGASISKAGGSVDFVSLVSYNRGIVVNFNPPSSSDYDSNFMTLSYVDQREFMDREERIDLDVVKLSPMQDVNIRMNRLPETNSVELQLQYYNARQLIAFDGYADLLPEFQNIKNDYLRLDEENPSFEKSLRLPVGSPVKIFYSVNDGDEKDSTIMVTSTTSSVNLEF